ncbi:MAG: ABC transporter ATP-binding protein [Burkholderiales bacterium]|nr:ABC transporter ATP-binding protein [Anaerolineae bacterium]
MGISCKGVSYSYPLPKGQTLTSLQNVSFTVETGQFVSLVGPSGCGKSTLLKLFAKLLRPTSGTVHFTDVEADSYRPEVGMVFQQHGVFPWLNVLDNVVFGLQRHPLSRAEKNELARAYIDRVHLTGFETAYPHQLSGGMQQRVNIARALVSQAPTLLMDEPFGSLDAQTRLVMQEELLTIWESERKTVVYVTHDIDESLLLADRVLVMSSRPGVIKADITVPIPRPRHLNDIENSTLRELRWHIWNLLELKNEPRLT